MTAKFIKGGCRCGQVRYRTRLHALPLVYACHCRDCQTWTGTAFSLQFILAEEDLAVSGDLGLFDLLSPDGLRTSRQRACPICFSRVYNSNTGRPGSAIMRAGTLDRSDELQIAAHIWTSRMVTGIAIADGVPRWPESAPVADLAAALAGA